MQDIAPTMAEAEEGFRLLARAYENNISSNKACMTKNLELAFLRDIKDYPDSGIAARYKRIGLSVRQGQKLKSQALQQLLIEGTIETTKTGRQTFIRLTEKGKTSLSAAS